MKKCIELNVVFVFPGKGVHEQRLITTMDGFFFACMEMVSEEKQQWRM